MLYIIQPVLACADAWNCVQEKKKQATVSTSGDKNLHKSNYCSWNALWLSTKVFDGYRTRSFTIEFLLRLPCCIKLLFVCRGADHFSILLCWSAEWVTNVLFHTSSEAYSDNNPTGIPDWLRQYSNRMWGVGSGEPWPCKSTLIWSSILAHQMEGDICLHLLLLMLREDQSEYHLNCPQYLLTLPFYMGEQLSRNLLRSKYIVGIIIIII